MASATINLSPTVHIDFVSKKHDRVSFDFAVLDDNDSPVNFSGYTYAKMTLRNNELDSEVISFHSTGATYQIDISNRSDGAFVVSCDSLNVEANTYLYDLQLYNTTQIETVMAGKYQVNYQLTQ